MSASTSSRSGKRPSAFFEKASLPSIVTSKTPPLLFTSVGAMPRSRWISAANLEARGR